MFATRFNNVALCLPLSLVLGIACHPLHSDTPSSEPRLGEPPHTYSVAQSFSANANPNGPWCFGWKPAENGPLTLLTLRKERIDRNKDAIHCWRLTDGDGPSICEHVASALARGPNETIDVIAGNLSQPEYCTVARFTVPLGQTGTYQIETGAKSHTANASLSGAHFQVLSNGVEIYGRVLSSLISVEYTNLISFNEGDAVDFQIARGNNRSPEELGFALFARLKIATGANLLQSVCVGVDPSASTWLSFDEEVPNLGAASWVLEGSPLFLPGKVGRALHFDGVDDAVQLAADRSVNIGEVQGFSVEFWLALDGTNSHQPLLSWTGSSDGKQGVQVAASVEGPGSLFADLVDARGNSHRFSTRPGILSTGVFEHVALTFDRGSGHAFFYLNGTRVAERNLGNFVPATTGDLWLGWALPNEGKVHLRGLLDEVTLYTRPLSEADTRAIVHAGTAGKCRPLWFSQGLLNSTVYDLSEDFAPNESPVGPWQFGSKARLDGHWEPLSRRKLISAENGVLMNCWQLKEETGPAACQVLGPETAVSRSGQFVAPRESFFLASGDGANPSYGVLRFTVPPGCSANYRIETGVIPAFSGSFQRAADFHVLKNDKVLFDRFVSPRDSAFYSNHMALAEGDRIDIAVGRGTNELGLASLVRLFARFTDLHPNSAGSNHCASAPGGLCLSLPFEGTTENRVDGNIAEAVGSLEFLPGKVGAGLHFDGVENAVRVPHSDAIDLGQADGLSVEFWLKPESLRRWNALVEWSPNRSGTPGVHLFASVYGTGSLMANLVDVNGVSHFLTTPPGVLSKDVFQHVALTYDRLSGEACLYHDGVDVAHAQLGSFIPDTRSQLWLGRRVLGGYPYWFHGVLDEVCLYKRALSKREIGSIYKSAAAGKCMAPPKTPTVACRAAPPGIVAWMPFDGDSHDTVSHANGSILGNPAFGYGRVGRAVYLKGQRTGIKYPTIETSDASAAAGIRTGSGMTVELWINPNDTTKLFPVIEWNSGEIGAHLWSGIDERIPGDGQGNLYANLVDTDGRPHVLRSPRNVVRDGAWQHIALTYDRVSGHAAIYHNGVAVAQQNLGQFVPAVGGDLCLGFRPAGPLVGTSFAGSMDEVTIYNRPLAMDEITSLFHAGAAGKCGDSDLSPP